MTRTLSELSPRDPSNTVPVRAEGRHWLHLPQPPSVCPALTCPLTAAWSHLRPGTDRQTNMQTVDVQDRQRVVHFLSKIVEISLRVTALIIGVCVYMYVHMRTAGEVCLSRFAPSQANLVHSKTILDNNSWSTKHASLMSHEYVIMSLGCTVPRVLYKILC